MNLLYTFLLLFSILFNTKTDATVSFGTGYRQDNLDWNIAGPDNVPNVLSELEWKDVKMWEVSARARQSILGLCFVAEADYAWVFDGRNRDSDYFDDNRRGEFSRTYADADRGYAYDICAGLGWNINFFISPLEISPQIGYSYHEQHFTMRNGVSEINLINNFIGPFDGLDSSYTARWQGPWAGFDACFCPYCPISIFGSFRASALCYDARAHWNLRFDFADDFRHHGYGYGLFGRVGIQYDVTNCLAIGVLGTYQDFRLCYGRDKMYFHVDFVDQNGNSVGSSVQSSSTRLNAVNWESFRAQLYLTYNF